MPLPLNAIALNEARVVSEKKFGYAGIMKLNIRSIVFTGAILAGSITGCATTKDATESGVENAEKQLETAPADAEKNADYVEQDAKKTTEGEQPAEEKKPEQK